MNGDDWTWQRPTRGKTKWNKGKWMISRKRCDLSMGEYVCFRYNGSPSTGGDGEAAAIATDGLRRLTSMGMFSSSLPSSSIVS